VSIDWELIVDTTAGEQVKALFMEQTRLECELVAERLREAFDSIEGTPYWADVDSVIGMLTHAEPTSTLHDFARILLGLPSATLGVNP